MIEWPIWTRSHTTDEVMPIEVSGPDGPVTEFLAAVTLSTDPHPTAGQFSPVAVDGDLTGPRVGATRGHVAGSYLAWPKVNGRVLSPVPFALT